jgi:hypothetical protein
MFPSHGAAGSATGFDGAPSRAARPLARRHRVGRWTPRPARLGFRVADLAHVHAFGHAMLRCDGEQRQPGDRAGGGTRSGQHGVGGRGHVHTAPADVSGVTAAFPQPVPGRPPRRASTASFLDQPPVRATQPCDPGVPVLALVDRHRLQPAPHRGPNDQVDPRPPRFVPSLWRQGGGDGLVTDPAQLGKVRLGLAVGVLDCLRQDALLGRPKTVATSHVRTVRVSTDREQLPATSVRGDVLRCERGGYTDA